MADNPFVTYLIQSGVEIAIGHINFIFVLMARVINVTIELWLVIRVVDEWKSECIKNII